MPIQWRILHARRLLLGMVKGELERGEMLALAAAVDAEKAVIYAKLFDVRQMTTIIPTDRLLTFAHFARLREATSAAGPVALIAGTGPQLAPARIFAEAGQVVRPIRVFVEHHQARRWIRELALDHAADRQAAAGSAVA